MLIKYLIEVFARTKLHHILLMIISIIVILLFLIEKFNLILYN